MDLQGRIARTAPACLKPVRKGPVQAIIEKGDPYTVAWRVGCACGATSGAVLGYPLGDFNTGYKGPMLFVTPLGYDCAACGKVTDFLDTDQHGYNSEIGKLEGGGGSAAYRGEGKRTRFVCPTCRKDRVEVTMQFAYWDGALEVLEEDPSLPAADFFNMAVCLAKCVGCGTVTPASEMEC